MCVPACMHVYICYAEMYPPSCVQSQELGHAYLSKLLRAQIKEEYVTVTEVLLFTSCCRKAQFFLVLRATGDVLPMVALSLL